jgi:hypothetical protein
VFFHDVKIVLEAVCEKGVDVLDWVKGSHFLACKVYPLSTVETSVEKALKVDVVS